VFYLCTIESRVILLPAIIQQLNHLFFIQDDTANQILGDILLQLHKERRVSLCIMWSSDVVCMVIGISSSWDSNVTGQNDRPYV